jgi:4-amino-4-deoxy-L-arabinose transferase-like glycosyltransferase
MAGACLLFHRLGRRRGATPGWAALLTLSLALATLCFAYGRVAYSEALQTFALLLLVERTLAAGDSPTVGRLALLGVCAGVLFNTKLVYALLLPLPAAWLIYLQARWRRTSLRRFLLGSLLAVLTFLPFFAVALWHNHIKTGSLLDSGYRIPGGVFSGDLLPGLYGFLLSTGKGMFLYSPPLVLGLLGLRTSLSRRREETWLLLSIIAVTLLFNAKFRHWHADYCWGPRHTTAITPLILLLALPWLPEALQRGRARLRRAALGLLLGAGLLVQLLGAAFYWDYYIRILIAVKDQTGAAGWFQEQLGHGHYIPQFSPLRGHLWMMSHLIRQDPDLDRDAPWKLIVPQRADLSAHYAAMRIDWWALDWLAGKEAPRGPGLVLLLLFGGGAVLCGVPVGRRLSAGRSAA